MINEAENVKGSVVKYGRFRKKEYDKTGCGT